MIDTRQKTIKSQPNLKVIRMIDEDLQFQTCVALDLYFVDRAFAKYHLPYGYVIIVYGQNYAVKMVRKNRSPTLLVITFNLSTDKSEYIFYKNNFLNNFIKWNV